MVDTPEEQEDIERIKNWWRDNGRFVLSGLALGVVILVGWRQWTDYQTERAEQASATYERLAAAVASDDRELALELGTVLSGEFASTPYADQAALLLARMHVDAAEYEEAATLLEGLIDSSSDEELAHVARLRLARVRLELQRHQEALAALDVEDPGAFAARYHAVRGDIRFEMGELDAARDEYEQALEEDAPGVIDRSLLQMKLDRLPGSSAETDPGSIDSE